MARRNRLKIGIPINTFILENGLPGIDKYTYYLILSLQRLEEVDVLVFQEKYRHNGPFERFDMCYFPIIRELLGIGHRADLTGESGPGGGGTGEDRSASGFSRFRRDMVKSIYYTLKGVDVIHYPTHMERPLSLTAARTVLTFHDIVPVVHPETSTKEIIDKFNLCTSRLRFVDSLITQSEFSKREMVDKLGLDPDRISVCHPGVDEMFFVDESKEEIRRKYADGSPYILFVGTLEPRKNVEAIIEAFEALERRDLKLLLVGKEGWGIDRIRSKVHERGLENEVTFSGYVPENDLPYLYRDAELFIFPSFYEGFGMPVLEAMAAGAPVVTARAASLPEVAGNCAVYVSPHDTREITEAVRGLLENRQLREELRVKGSRRAKEFTWDRCARGCLEVYRG